MWRRRLEGILSPRPNRDRSLSLAAWVLLNGSIRAAFSAHICCDIVQSSNNMVELGQVYRDGRAAGCELGLNLAEPHLRPRGPVRRQLDGNGGWGAGRRAWRAAAMAWISWTLRDIVSKRMGREARRSVPGL